jgi:hypothetical protein
MGGNGPRKAIDIAGRTVRLPNSLLLEPMNITVSQQYDQNRAKGVCQLDK